ncbi:FecR family protein [Rhodanobacter sp. Col0626]|uniref:FecR family protein n=1 Tax=Rhodanobacter sp. Col0626 TaxID=3415679 RepID=UPI003CFBAD61
MKSFRSDSPNAVPETAEAWLARLLAPDCSAQDKAAFARWREADAANADDFAEAEYLHETAAQLADDPLIRAATRAAKRQGADTRPRFGWIAASAAAAAVLVGALGLAIHRYQSAVPEIHYASTTTPQTITLTDGTRLQLDAGSSVAVQFGHARRVVKLERGRAEFTVAADARRPFEVQAGDATIRDIGTTFQVSRDVRGVEIGLLEGQVQITGKHDGQAWHRLLAPSEQLLVGVDGHAGPTEALDVDAAQSWPRGKLVFHERRLDELLIEANRYSALKLRIADPSLASLRVSGSIHAGDQETLVKSLEHGWQLRTLRTGPEEISIQR